jgi:hypothetical protein
MHSSAWIHAAILARVAVCFGRACSLLLGEQCIVVVLGLQVCRWSDKVDAILIMRRSGPPSDASQRRAAGLRFQRSESTSSRMARMLRKPGLSHD